MPLMLYRRHQKGCEAGFPIDHRTCEFDERKRNHPRCGCFIFASGSLNKIYRRKYTACADWASAREVAAGWEAAANWDATLAAPAPEPRARADNHKRQAIPDACKHFLAELSESAAQATHKKYRLLLRRFEAFSADRGFVYIDQWEPLDVRQFRSTWPVSPQTGIRRMAMMKPFFEYAVSNNWMASNPARAVKNPKGREIRHNEQKFPFTDAELKKMYEACERYGDTYRHKWKGQDLADFISIMTYTGLRISDVSLFNIDRMNENGEVSLRTTKAGTVVCTWVPEWLQERIRARAAKHGPYIFGAHKPTTIDIITETWRRRLNVIFDACGPWKIEPTPHRFRHTFARILLQKPGVTVRAVAELLGNTEEMVRKRYSAWIPERQAEITKMLKHAFADKPKPKLVKVK